MKKTVVYITTLFLLANGICFAGNIKKENKAMTNKKIVQTAGRNSLGTFAPEFAHFNDDVLFGENWNNKDLTLKTRSFNNCYCFNVTGNNGFFFKISSSKC